MHLDVHQMHIKRNFTAWTHNFNASWKLNDFSSASFAVGVARKAIIFCETRLLVNDMNIIIFFQQRDTTRRYYATGTTSQIILIYINVAHKPKTKLAQCLLAAGLVWHIILLSQLYLNFGKEKHDEWEHKYKMFLALLKDIVPCCLEHIFCGTF